MWVIEWIVSATFLTLILKVTAFLVLKALASLHIILSFLRTHKRKNFTWNIVLAIILWLFFSLALHAEAWMIVIRGMQNFDIDVWCLQFFSLRKLLGILSFFQFKVFSFYILSFKYLIQFIFSRLTLQDWILFTCLTCYDICTLFLNLVIKLLFHLLLFNLFLDRNVNISQWIFDWVNWQSFYLSDWNLGLFDNVWITSNLSSLMFEQRRLIKVSILKRLYYRILLILAIIWNIKPYLIYIILITIMILVPLDDTRHCFNKLLSCVRLILTYLANICL